MRGDTGYVVKGHEAARGAKPFRLKKLTAPPAPDGKPGCAVCRARRKREAAISQAAAEVVEILKKHGLSEMEVWDVLSTAGRFQIIEGMMR